MVNQTQSSRPQALGPLAAPVCVARALPLSGPDCCLGPPCFLCCVVLALVSCGLVLRSVVRPLAPWLLVVPTSVCLLASWLPFLADVAVLVPVPVIVIAVVAVLVPVQHIYTQHTHKQKMQAGNRLGF